MRKIIFIILFCPLFIIKCSAEGLVSEAAGAIDAYSLEEALSDEERDISGNLSLDGAYDHEGAISRLVRHLFDSALREYKMSLGDAVSITALSFLCSLLAAFCSDKKYTEFISAAGVCAVALISLGGVDSIVSQAGDAIIRLSDYSKAAMPVVFTAAAAIGAVASSAAKYAAVCIAVDVLISVSQKLIIPCVYAFLALAVAKSLFKNSIVCTCAGFIKWVSTTVMIVLTIAFSSYIGMTGLIAGSTDAAAVKATRTVISTVLPVVGSIISDSASVVLSAAGIIKNSVGVFALISVGVLCAGPFAALGVKLLMFKAAGALSSMASNERLTELINDVGKALSMLLGMVGCCGIMLFISFMAAIKAAI